MKIMRICVAVLAALVLSLGGLYAQPKAAGCIFSTSRLGVTYEHSMEKGNFLSVDLSLDTDDVIWKRADHPGVTASFVWNMVFAEKDSAYGNRISFFAGPGLMAGYVTDYGSKAGIAFGLKGCIGVECRFRRPFILSATLSPTIGTHMTSKDGNTMMKLYRCGLIETIIPNIGIKYAF